MGGPACSFEFVAEPMTCIRIPKANVFLSYQFLIFSSFQAEKSSTNESMKSPDAAPELPLQFSLQHLWRFQPREAGLGASVYPKREVL